MDVAGSAICICPCLCGMGITLELAHAPGLVAPLEAAILACILSEKNCLCKALYSGNYAPGNQGTAYIQACEGNIRNCKNPQPAKSYPVQDNKKDNGYRRTQGKQGESR